MENSPLRIPLGYNDDREGEKKCCVMKWCILDARSERPNERPENQIPAPSCKAAFENELNTPRSPAQMNDTFHIASIVGPRNDKLKESWKAMAQERCLRTLVCRTQAGR